MACYHPIKAWKGFNDEGRLVIVFNARKGYQDRPVQLACGQCVGCRLERSRQWAVRCSHEAKLHEENSFITLTYNNQNLPKNGSLNKRHFQLFMKRLRKRYPGRTIRYFHCGEYGEENGRPHYHACLFGFDFADKKFYKQTPRGDTIYTSAKLEELWGLGFCTIGSFTFESAAYVARYVMKKVTGDMAEWYYETVDWETGELQQMQPEYVTMSRNPGLGADWYEIYTSDVHPRDYVVINGKKSRPPRFYDERLKEKAPKVHRSLKGSRVAKARDHVANNTPERRRVREKVQLRKLQQLKRNEV